MNLFTRIGSGLLALALPAAGALTQAAPRRPAASDALLDGTEAALQAYTRASDAYLHDFVAPSVALWSVGIAVAVVLLEWLIARAGRR